MPSKPRFSAAGGWIPHAVCHLFTFYLGFAFVAMGRRRGIVWSEQSFKKAEEVAWHFPMIVTCFPFGLAAFRAMWRLLSSGDDAARFGPLDTTLTPANLVDLAYLTPSQAAWQERMFSRDVASLSGGGDV